jgi:hypothetical protein
MTGDDYLQLSLNAVQQLVHDTRVLQLKEKQCRLLTLELLKVAMSVRAAVDRLPTEKQACVGNRHEFASQELYRWVTESAAIINSCRAEDSVKKAVEPHDTTEMFVEAIFNLRWCGAVLESVILNAANNTTRSDLQRSATEILRRFGAAACESMKEKIRNLLNVLAMQDYENSRRRLHVRSVENVNAGKVYAKLCDFGSPMPFTSSSSYVGTSGYLAPELNELTKLRKRNLNPHVEEKTTSHDVE